MKKFKKIVAMCLATVMAMSVMCVGVFAADNDAVATEVTGGIGEGVSTMPPQLIDNTIQPYGSSPPGSSASTHNLDSSDYYGSIEWMGSYMYSNKWLKTNGYKIEVWSNLKAYYNQSNAINQTNPLSVNTQTSFRLVGNDGSSTSWKAVSNVSSGSVTFGVTPGTKYYLEIRPVSGYYTAGSFTVSAVD